MPALADPQRAIAHRQAIYHRGKVLAANGGSLDIFPTGIIEPAGLVLRGLVAAEGATVTIETGFGLGLSTLFVVEGAGIGARHTAIDPYQKSDWQDAGVRTITDAGLADRVELIREDSAIALPLLLAEGRTFELGFVDGGHHFEHVFLDIYYMTRLVRPGGLVIVDDLWMPAVQAAVAYARTNLGCAAESRPDPAAKRFAILRLPPAPPQRAWDHFIPFAAPGSETPGNRAT